MDPEAKTSDTYRELKGAHGLFWTIVESYDGGETTIEKIAVKST